MRCSRVSQGWTGPVNVTSRVPRDADPETEVCLQDFYRGVLSDQNRGAMKGAALGRCICNKVSRSARQGSSLRNLPLRNQPLMWAAPGKEQGLGPGSFLRGSWPTAGRSEHSSSQGNGCFLPERMDGRGRMGLSVRLMTVHYRSRQLDGADRSAAQGEGPSRGGNRTANCRGTEGTQPGRQRLGSGQPWRLPVVEFGDREVCHGGRQAQV